MRPSLIQACIVAAFGITCAAVNLNAYFLMRGIAQQATALAAAATRSSPSIEPARTHGHGLYTDGTWSVPSPTTARVYWRERPDAGRVIVDGATAHHVGERWDRQCPFCGSRRVTWMSAVQFATRAPGFYHEGPFQNSYKCLRCGEYFEVRSEPEPPLCVATERQV